MSNDVPYQVKRALLILVACVKIALTLAIGFSMLIVATALYSRGVRSEPPLQIPYSLPNGLRLLAGAIVLRLIISRFSLSLARAAATHLTHRRKGLSHLDATNELARRARTAFLARFSNEKTIKDTIDRLMNPREAFDRISESVELSPASQQRTVRLTLRVKNEDFPVLIPLLEQAKDELVDDLDVEIDGSPATTLPYIENQGAMLVVALTLADKALGGKADAPIAKALSAISSLLASTSPADPADLLAELDDFESGGQVQDAKAFAALRNLVEVGAQHYFILGEIAPGSDRRIIMRISSRASTGSHRPYIDSPRVALGLRPREYNFQLRRAIGTPSYHFFMRTPKGTYIFDRWFEPSTFSEPKAMSTLPSELRPKYLISPSTKYLHAYVRNANYDDTVIPALRVQLRERPPALLEVAGALSLLLATIVWFVGRFHDQVFMAASSNSRVVPAAWTTLLFGVPTLLVGWLVTRIDGASLARTSLRSLGMVGWLGLNSFAAVLAAGFKASGAELTKERVHFWAPFTVTHPIWAMVMMSCAIHVTLSFVFIISRAIRFTLALSGLTYRYRRSEV